MPSPAEPMSPAHSQPPGNPVKVHNYFASRAGTYAEKSKRGLWGFLRGLETPALMRLAGVKMGEKLRNAGAGAGHYTEALMRRGAEVTALDIEPAMIAALRERLKVRTLQGELLVVRL